MSLLAELLLYGATAALLGTLVFVLSLTIRDLKTQHDKTQD